MNGTNINMTPTLKPAFMPGSTQRGWIYELRDTSDDSKSRAVYVQDDQQIILHCGADFLSPKILTASST